MNSIISGNQDVLKHLHHSEKGVELSETMTPSIFNYYQPEKNGNTLIYNTLSNALLRLTKNEYEKLLGKKRVGKELRQAFFHEGLLKPTKLDELKEYSQWAKKQRASDKPYLSLNITTTMKCNAHCSYCYEQGTRKTEFSMSKLAAIMKFIKSRVHEHERVRLNWFGGEPLLKPEVLDCLTRELRKTRISYSSYLITNGSLITKTMVKRKFLPWRVKDIQISIDGLKDTYERRKAYLPRRKDVFERILDTIDLLAQEHIRVHIRLNIDRDNSKEILCLVSMIEERYGNVPEVTYYPAFLTGIGLDMSEDEKVSYIKQMLSHAKDLRKTGAPKRLYQMPKAFPCMRHDQRSITIDTGGNLYTCEHLVGRPEKAIGTLTNFDENRNALRTRLKLRTECKKCVFLPKCMGGCAANLETNDEPCMIDKYMIQGYLAYMAKI